MAVERATGGTGRLESARRRGDGGGRPRNWRPGPVMKVSRWLRSNTVECRRCGEVYHTY